MPEIITNNLELWTSALLTKSTASRDSNDKLEAYGIRKLHELILELAVRGKLAPQDPNDEPARELLKKVAIEKARMVKEGIIRKEKDFPTITNEEIPFNIPRGWEWARIDDVGHDWGQNTPDADFTYIDVSAIDNISGVISSPSVLSASDAPSRARKIVKRGTVIYSTVRPYLKNICVIEEEYVPEPIASTAFAILHPFQDMSGKFFSLYFRSPEFVKYVESVQTGIAYPAINDKQFYGGLVPVPPLAEQHRIVAKVDELMALCDELEQQQSDSLQAHQTLVETLLGTLTKVASQQDLSEAWSRIANHFDTLFATEHSIDQLKQTILQLAVMGKLVSQDPNDEPASELLKRIQVEKARMVKEGIIKKEKPVETSEAEVTPFATPETWVWAQLGELTELITKGSSPKWQGVAYVSKDDGILFITSENVGNYRLRKLDELKYIEKRFNEIEPRSILRFGDILMNLVGASIGRTAVYDLRVEANINQAVALIRLIQSTPNLSQGFLLHYLNSPSAIDHMMASQVVNAQPNISLTDARQFPIPIPPLAEQHRIVAKVDELMALCNALKARLSETQITQIHLADAIVEQAVS